MTIQPKPIRGEFITRQLTQTGLTSWLDAANFQRSADIRDRPLKTNRVFDEALTVDVRNTGANCRELQPLEILTPSILPAEISPQSLWTIENNALDVQIPTGGRPQYFVLPLAPIKANRIGQAAIAGVVATKVFVPANGDWIDRAGVISGTNTLVAKPNGSAHIIWKDAGTDTTVDAIVRLNVPQNVHLIGKASGTIAHDTTTGAMEVYTDPATATGYLIGTGQSGLDEPLHLDWMEGDLDISDGKEILITWFTRENVWRVIGAECEDPPTPPMTFRGEWDPNF